MLAHKVWPEQVPGEPPKRDDRATEPHVPLSVTTRWKMSFKNRECHKRGCERRHRALSIIVIGNPTEKRYVWCTSSMFLL